jgi:hypothetical protein
MRSNNLTLLVAAFIISASAPAWSQGGGGGGASGASGGAAAGASGSGTSASTSAGSATGGTQGTVGPSAGSGTQATVGAAPTGGTEDTAPMIRVPTNTSVNAVQNGAQTRSKAPPGSPTAIQAQRNAGVGTAPNGLPIGSRGSGLGSPEQPVNSRRR